MAEALLAFGGNVGDVAAAIGTALRRLAESGVRIERVSSLYRTPAWGPVAQPDFVNGCASAETDLQPCALLALTQTIEREGGREAGPRWGPRPIDIDILAYDDLQMDEPGLTLPHARVAERVFVLVPLAEIAPDRIIAGRRVRDLAEAVDKNGIERIAPGPAPPRPTRLRRATFSR